MNTDGKIDGKEQRQDRNRDIVKDSLLQLIYGALKFDLFIVICLILKQGYFGGIYKGNIQLHFAQWKLL